MRKIIDPFTDYLPHLDLHGETTATCVYLVESFLRDNVKLRNTKVVIIHGKGSGAIRGKTHELLKKNKTVSKYYIDGLNDGQTIVELKIARKIWQNLGNLVILSPNGNSYI